MRWCTRLNSGEEGVRLIVLANADRFVVKRVHKAKVHDIKLLIKESRGFG